MKIGIIGAGNMGTALLSACQLAGYPTDDLLVSVATKASQSELTQLYPKLTLLDNVAVAMQCDVLFLAVKPFVMETVMQEIAPLLHATPKLVLSVAAGLPLSYYTAWLGKACPLVRAMPNTPVQINKGFTGLLANGEVSFEQKDWVTQLFDTIGGTLWLQNDNEIDKITALTSSGTAYYFYILDAMQKAAMNLGFESSVAKDLVLKTAEGAILLAQKSEASFFALQQAVTSKRGTTEAALAILDRENIQIAFQNAIQAAYNRAQEISHENETHTRSHT